MRLRNLSRFGLASLLALVLANIAEARDVFKAIPRDAIAFATFSRLAETDARVQQLAGELKLPRIQAMELLKTAAGVKEGIDEKGTAALVIFPAEEDLDQPRAVLLVPVTDYDALLKQLKPENPDAAVARVTLFDAPLLLARKGDFAVVAKRGEEELLTKVLADTKGVAAEMAGLGEWPGKFEVTGALTRRGIELLAEKGIDELRKARDQFKQLATEMEELGGPMENLMAAFKMYEQFLQAWRDETALMAGGLHLDDEGNLLAEGRVRLVPEGVVAKGLVGAAPIEGDLLAGLPTDPYVVAMAMANPSGLTEAMTRFSLELVKNNPVFRGMVGKPENMKELVELSVASAKRLESLSFVFGVGKDRDPIYSATAGIIAADDPKAYLDDYVAAIKKMRESAGDEKSMVGGMNVQRERIAGREGVRLTFKIPMSFPMPDVPEEVRKQVEQSVREMMERMYGPGGELTVYMAPAGEKTLAMGYTSKGQVEAIIQARAAGKPGLAGDAQLAKTAALLPRKAAALIYWSPRGTIAFGARMIKVMAGDAGTPIDIPSFPESPPIGAAVTVVPNEIRIHVAAPLDMLKASADFYRKVEGALGGEF